jgi:hypothetical protein
MIAIFQKHGSIVDIGVGVNLDVALLPRWHRLIVLGMGGVAYIPLAADMLRGVSTRESRLGKFGGVF